MHELPIALIVAGITVILIVLDQATLGLTRRLGRWLTGAATNGTDANGDDTDADDAGEEDNGGPDDGLPTFRVLALGLKGAGKTVLLASMHHELGPDVERGWFLGGDFEQHQFLAGLYRELHRSPDWAPATLPGDTREFLFDCRVFARPGDERTALRISYLDYSGEGVGPGSDLPALSAALKMRAEKAHALLVMIDGERVSQLLNSPHDADGYFSNEMGPLLGLAREAKCPVQLVITKWDLLCSSIATSEQQDELLRRIRRRLMQYGPIRQLVDAHCHRDDEVRLIPLSAVGSEFAELRADGTVAKRPDRKLDPINVDVPLCVVISDVLERMERSLDPAVRQQLDDEIDRAPRGDVTSTVASVLGSHVGIILRTALAAYVGDALVTLLVELIVARRSSGAPVPSSAAQADEAETQRLRAEVVIDMKRVVKRLETDLESSNLCMRRSR
jgi:hypothetical protein